MALRRCRAEERQSFRVGTGGQLLTLRSKLPQGSALPAAPHPDRPYDLDIIPQFIILDRAHHQNLYDSDGVLLPRYGLCVAACVTKLE